MALFLQVSQVMPNPDALSEKLIEALTQAIADLRQAIPATVTVTVTPTAAELLTVEQVAEQFQMSKSYLYHHWRQIPGARKVGQKSVRFTAEGLRDYLKGQRR
jgi:predicted DNA-binding transcriptional regulator AlpA